MSPCGFHGWRKFKVSTSVVYNKEQAFSLSVSTEIRKGWMFGELLLADN